MHLRNGVFTGKDSNGQLGQNRDRSEEVMGEYGYGERSKEEKKIMEFCQGRGRVVANTILKKEERW